MKNLSRSGFLWGFPLGVVTLGLALACTAKKDDPGENQPNGPRDLEPGEQQCRDEGPGRVCVHNGSPRDGGTGEVGENLIPLPDGGGLDGGAIPAVPRCSVIHGKVRDFRRGDKEDGHPDFETQMGSGEKGLLEPELSASGRPVLAATDPVSIQSAESFAQWYEDVPGVNMTFDISLELTDEDGYQVFGTTLFFPLDDLGFGQQGQSHNFGFTTELHARFLYDGGGSFQLAGDDDLWLFVNKRLVIDLGGVHGWQSFTLQLADVAEELGLEVGGVYSLDLFHAERHSTESKFYAKTNLVLVDCN